LRIQLFGSPAILVGDRRFRHRSRKAMALLAYLAMRADEHVSRSHLASLLWGDSGEEQARANLRQTLSQLRRLFRDAGHDPIMVPFDQVVLQSDNIEVDALELLNARPEDFAGSFETLPEFLEGFAVPAPEFETWMMAQRNKIRARTVALLEATAAKEFEAGEYATAAEKLSLALTIDPLQESIHRNLMKTHNAQGRTDAALSQFEACRRILARELQIEPDAETRRLATEIRAQRQGHTNELGLSEAFRRYPAARPTLVFTYLAGLDATGRDRPIRFPDAQAALSAALEQSRVANDPRSMTLTVVPDSGDEKTDRAEADALAICAEPGKIAVHGRIFDQFRHWSPFTFRPIDSDRGGPEAYRLLSEMPRHRLQVMPANDAPHIEPFSEFSVAVLPLADRSPNAAAFALGDVVAEEITHRLSRFRNLTVAAPSAGQAFRVKGFQIGEARTRLGVNYLVDGSLFRSEDRLRVNLSLTDLRNGILVFSDHFEGAFDAIFSHQDDVIDRIATSIFRKAETAELRRAERAPTRDIGAYEWYLRGLALHRRAGISPDNARQAFSYFTRAIDIDPDFARAYAWRICSVGWYAPEYFVDPGLKEIHYALSRAEHDAEVQRIAGALHLYRGDYEDGIRHIERAVELNPSDAYLLAASAVYWAYYGEPQSGLKHIERALTLDPFLPVWCVEDHGVVLYTMGHYSEAIESLERLSFPTPRALAFLAASHIAKGDMDRARAAVANILHIARDYSVDQLMMTNYYRHEGDKKALRERLHQAGLT
jgi:adenylate cyclase